MNDTHKMIYITYFFIVVLWFSDKCLHFDFQIHQSSSDDNCNWWQFVSITTVNQIIVERVFSYYQSDGVVNCFEFFYILFVYVDM